MAAEQASGANGVKEDGADVTIEVKALAQRAEADDATQPRDEEPDSPDEESEAEPPPAPAEAEPFQLCSTQTKCYIGSIVIPCVIMFAFAVF